MSQSPSAKPERVKRLSRLRSLVWVMPERSARAAAWVAIVLFAAAPLALVVALTARESAGRPEARLGAMLSKDLATDAHVGRIKPESARLGRLGDVAFEALSLRAAGGAYHAPSAGFPGTLDLENGSFAADLDAFAKTPSPCLQRILDETARTPELRALSLTAFAAELKLAGETVKLRPCAASIERADTGALRGAFTGRSGADTLRMTFEISAGAGSLSVSAKSLPWAKRLLVPTLGEAMAGALEPVDGKLTIGSALKTGAEGDAWQLKAKTALDLARVPAGFGLAGMTGRIEIDLDASGPMDGPATVKATLHSPRGGALPRETLLAIFNLLDATLEPASSKDPIRFETLDLAVIITRDQIYLTVPTRRDRTAAVYAADREPIMTFYPRGIPLRDFQRRLDNLRSRWKAAHAS